MSDKSHQEPFLINAATGSASAGYHPVGESKEGQSDDRNNVRTSSTLRRRRRYRRRGATQNSDSEQEEKQEEKKRDDSYSPRDKPEAEQQEEKKEDVTPPRNNERNKPPRHPAPSAQPPIDDTLATSKATKSTPPRPSLPIMHQSNYIRRQPDEKLREKFQLRERSMADGIPEVHFIGEVTEGIGFKDTYVSCKWYLEWGKSWSFLAGEESSQTQYSGSDDNVHVWNHPIDVHFASASMQGWPRIILQVWELDENGRSILAAYGFSHLPTNPGHHELEVRCWRPSGSVSEELASFFLGTSSCLADESMIFGKAWETRSQLTTVSSGMVKMNVNVLLRFFNEHKVV